MEVLPSLTTNLVSALIGRQILGQAISDASYSIYGTLGCIFSYDTTIDDTIRSLDIKARIKMVDSLIKHIDEYNDTITTCLTGLHEIIILIREDLKQINSIILEHKRKYLSNWRHLDCRKQIKSLRINSKLLDTRLDFLIKALEVIRYNSDMSKNQKNIKIKHKLIKELDAKKID